MSAGASHVGDDRRPGPGEASRFWQHFAALNRAQLDQQGYANFKRGIILNYFTTVPDRRGDYQLAFLRRHLPARAWAAALIRTLAAERHTNLSWKQSRTFTLLTHLVWEYVRREDHTGLLDRLAEPPEGNPARIVRGGRLISQDIANSVLETGALLQGGALTPHTRTVLELGAGYGRTAYAILHAAPHVRYVIADISPALELAQRYLTTLFPERPAFLVQKFSGYEQIAGAFERSTLAFLRPEQLALLPPGSVDLVLNISSFHEMRHAQINAYFDQIERLASGYLYLKQWKESHNRFDGITVRDEDYPVRPSWQPVFWRECRIHTPMFEALLRL